MIAADIDSIISIINVAMKESNKDSIAVTKEQADEDLATFGMDSLLFIRIIVALEAAFEIEYPDEFLLIAESNTINKLVSIVSCALEKKAEEEQND